MSRPTVIDADGHVQEKYIRWEDYLEEPYRSQAPRGVKDNRGVDFLMVEGKLWPKPSGPGVGNVGAGYSRRPQATTGMADPVQRIKDVDLEGIDTAVLFGTNVFLSLAYYEDADNACALARAYNNWLAESCSQDRARLIKGVALVRIQEPLEAAKELRRCVTELGFVAVGTPAHSSTGRNLDNPALRPFFAAAEELDVPVCIHVGAGRTAAGTERSTNAFFNHVITRPFEQMIGALCIVAGGILEEFPRLRVAFLEAGAGWVPYWMSGWTSTTSTCSRRCRGSRRHPANTCAASRSSTPSSRTSRRCPSSSTSSDTTGWCSRPTTITATASSPTR